MDIKEIRRINLRTLMNTFVDQGNSKAKFAEAIGIPASQLSQLTSSNASRNIGDTIARRVEVSLELAYGWLDIPHSHEAIESYENGLLKNKINNLEENSVFRIVQLDTELSCGKGTINTEHPDLIKSIEIDPEYAKGMFGSRNSDSLRIATAVGDSMLGTVSPGELIILDITVKGFIGDGIYAFSYDESTYLKRMQKVKDRLLIISDNKSYEQWDVGPKDECMLVIHGLVIGKWNIRYTRLG